LSPISQGEALKILKGFTFKGTLDYNVVPRKNCAKIIESSKIGMGSKKLFVGPIFKMCAKGTWPKIYTYLIFSCCKEFFFNLVHHFFLLVFLASIEHHGFKSSSGVLFGSLYGVSISNILCHSFTTTNDATT
jgi:hypothetical protein